MRTIRDLKLTPVWVNPLHQVSSAVHLLKGHQVPAVPVLDGDHLVGIITYEQLVGAAESLRVRDVMIPVPAEIPATMPIRRVAELFTQKSFEWAPVVDEHHHLLGVVTSTMLLRELARSWDPLTNLSWSDALREWGVEQLTEGQEITIVFVDLDDFGEYNKKYGHIVGDRILRYIADFLKQNIEPGTDLLVRYGGDEFAIGSIRSRASVDALVTTLNDRMLKIPIDDLPEPVTWSIGVFGGRRGRERENVHVAATLDSLINLASRDCLAKKLERKKTSVPESTPESPTHSDPQPTSVGGEGSMPLPSLLMVSAGEFPSNAPSTVGLRHEGAIFTGVDVPGSRPVAESVARATARALERAVKGVVIQIGEVALIQGPESERLVSVAGTVADAQGERTMAALGPVGEDLFRSIAETTIEAFAGLAGIAVA